MTTNPRKTPTQWAEIVASFHASGLTQREFCDRHGIGSSTLDKWKRRVAESAPGQTSPASFIRVHPISDAENTTVTLQTDNGLRVLCPLSIGIDTIAALTRAIGHEG